VIWQQGRSVAILSTVQPRKPANASPYARLCLEAIAAAGLGSAISIGGAFGLSHYLEYRTTHDLDAWWTDGATPDIRRRVVSAIEEAFRREGTARNRSWGEVTSIELVRGGSVVFGFQVAGRSALLQAPREGPWPGGILIDSLDDLVASKMVALVERGLPRDFRDIHAVCEAGLCDPTGCWRLWEARQRASGERADPSRARLAISSHLARIETARPLEGIENADQRGQASRVRAWIKRELLGED
jgi:hypothetical protein